MLIFQFFFTDYDGEEVLPTQNQYASIDEIIEIMQSVLIMIVLYSLSSMMIIH